MRIALLACGDLGSLVLKKLMNSMNIVFVMTNKNSLAIIKICEDYEIPFFIGNPRNGKASQFFEKMIVDVLISVNYTFLIENDLIKLPKKLAFNIHGSLLPKYRGRTPHVWAIINNESETGITTHLIDEGCDTGDIISQTIIPIDSQDTGGHLLEKFKNLYVQVIQKILLDIDRGRLEIKPQDESKATYFGRRTPDDGLINWSWQKERIRNWVRAQSYPYPGAFSFYENKKIVIDEVVYDDAGFHSEMANGTIISENPVLVKTPNGVLRFSKIRNLNTHFKKGTILK